MASLQEEFDAAGLKFNEPHYLNATLQAEFDAAGLKFNEPYYLPRFLYRSLRPNEIGQLIKYGGLVAHCYPCPPSGPPQTCCDIDVEAHIRAGTRAKVKSRYISLSGLLRKTCDSTARPRTAPDAFMDDDAPTQRADGSYVKSGLAAVIDTRNLDLRLLKHYSELNLSGSGLTTAKASDEYIYPDTIPTNAIAGFLYVHRSTKAAMDAAGGEDSTDDEGFTHVMFRRKTKGSKKTTNQYLRYRKLTVEGVIQMHRHTKRNMSGSGRAATSYARFVKSVYDRFRHLPNRERFSAIAAAWRATQRRRGRRRRA